MSNNIDHWEAVNCTLVFPEGSLEVYEDLEVDPRTGEVVIDLDCEDGGIEGKVTEVRIGVSPRIEVTDVRVRGAGTRPALEELTELLQGTEGSLDVVFWYESGDVVILRSKNGVVEREEISPARVARVLIEAYPSKIGG